LYKATNKTNLRKIAIVIDKESCLLFQRILFEN